MNAPAAPQVAPNGYPAMKVVRALAAASKRVAEVECNGKSGDPRDPYAYARADDLVAAAKDAIHAEGLLVLPASSDERPEPVGNGAVIWLRQTFNVVHVESGEWLPFSADPWPLQQHKPIDKAMATAKTASKAYFYLSLLEIRRVGPNAEDMDADLPPPAQAEKAEKPAPRVVADSSQVGISAKAKQGPGAVRMRMLRDSENREKVDPEALKAELDSAAREAFGGDGPAVHVDPDPTMPPTPAKSVLAAKDAGGKWIVVDSSWKPADVSSQPDSGNSDTSSEAACKSGPESTPPKASGGASSMICIAHRSKGCAKCGPEDPVDAAFSESTSGAGGLSTPSLSPPAPGVLKSTPRIYPRDPRIDPMAGDEVCFGRPGSDVAIVQGVAELEGKGPMVEFVLACDEDERSHFQSLSGWRFLFMFVLTEDDTDGTLGGVVQHVEPSKAEILAVVAESDPKDMERLTEEDWGSGDSRPLVQPTTSQVQTVGLLAKRVAEGRASKWAKSHERKARGPFWCAECQEEGPNANPAGSEAIKKGDKHRDKDGTPAGRCCLSCYERLMSEAAAPEGAPKADKESAA